MLNFKSRDGAPADPKEAGKFALKPALYEPPSGAIRIDSLAELPAKLPSSGRRRGPNDTRSG